MDPEIPTLEDRIAKHKKTIEAVRQEVRRVLVGQNELLDRMLIALLTGGHMLLEGLPGLAKTTAVKTLSAVLGLKFQRISFTPDLLPADVVGTLIYNPKDASFEPRRGPVFTNLLLADEINRAPAKVQSALLEAMQERQVTIGSATYELPSPFMVMATQNPIEQEGTYSLPEAQIDRFMMKCKIDYPDRDDERQIMNRFSRQTVECIDKVLEEEEIRELRSLTDEIYCDDKVGEYILDIVFATRDTTASDSDIAHLVEYGASPRATLYLNMAARAHALLNGRAYATPQDVKDVAYDVLRHRIILTYEAEAEEVTSEDIVTKILSEVRVP